MVRGSPITLAEESVDDLLSRQEVTDALAAGIHSGDVVAVRGLIDKRGPYSYWLFQVGGDALVAAEAFEDDRGRRAPDIPSWLDVLRGQLAGAHVLEGEKGTRRDGQLRLQTGKRRPLAVAPHRVQGEPLTADNKDGTQGHVKPHVHRKRSGEPANHTFIVSAAENQQTTRSS